MEAIPTKRPQPRDREAEARKLKRRFQTFSRKHFADSRFSRLGAITWGQIFWAFAFGALASWALHAWVWNSNLWPSTQALLEAWPVYDCTTARNIGAAPLYKGFSGYRESLDADHDGIACEPYGL